MKKHAVRSIDGRARNSAAAKGGSGAMAAETLTVRRP